MTRTELKRSGVWNKGKEREQHEAKQATVLEGTNDRLGLFDLHKVDWLHCVTPRTDRGSLRSGFPDYMMGGIHIVTKVEWMGFLETKHGNVPGVKGIGRLSDSQHNFHAWLRRRGQDILTAWLPDDLPLLNEWLFERSGRRVDIDGIVEWAKSLAAASKREKFERRVKVDSSPAISNRVT